MKYPDQENFLLPAAYLHAMQLCDDNPVLPLRKKAAHRIKRCQHTEFKLLHFHCPPDRSRFMLHSQQASWVQITYNLRTFLLKSMTDPFSETGSFFRLFQCPPWIFLLRHRITSNIIKHYILNGDIRLYKNKRAGQLTARLPDV